jgi:hypothetical protein
LSKFKVGDLVVSNVEPAETNRKEIIGLVGIIEEIREGFNGRFYMVKCKKTGKLIDIFGFRLRLATPLEQAMW